jgi:CBS domain containing-hemolysin-like protein
MKLKQLLLQKCAAIFYRIAQAFIVTINRDLKTALDEFWSSVSNFLLSDHAVIPFDPLRLEMIEGIYNLKEKKIREVMVPRTELAAVRVSDSIEKVASMIYREGRSRIPVFEDNIDNIVGILHVKDVFTAMATSQGKVVSIEKIMREPYFVPETKSVFDLLQELKKRRGHLAVVIDEYGGIAGIVTLEDLIEEIIGEVQDEYDNEKERIVKLDETSWQVEAKTTIDDLNQALGLDIPQDEDYDTLAGYIMATLGRIPDQKERFEADGLTFVVTESSEKCIEKVKIIKITDSDEIEGEDNRSHES